MAHQNEFNLAYHEFVSAWLEHEGLRGAGFAERIESRQRLDDLRLRMRAFAGHLGG